MPPQQPFEPATLPPPLRKVFDAAKKRASLHGPVKVHLPKIVQPAGPLIRKGLRPVLPKPAPLLFRELKGERRVP
jgi:hypothetical protein